MKNIDMKITEEIAVLSVSGSGYTKEVNLVSWNGAEPKYDIRSWSPGREKCGKGIVLTQDEVKNLFLALQKVLFESCLRGGTPAGVPPLRLMGGYTAMAELIMI